LNGLSLNLKKFLYMGDLSCYVKDRKLNKLINLLSLRS